MSGKIVRRERDQYKIDQDRQGSGSRFHQNTSPIWVMHALLLASCGGDGGSSGTPPMTTTPSSGTTPGATTTPNRGTTPTTPSTGTPPGTGTPPSPTTGKSATKSLEFALATPYKAIQEGTTENRVALTTIKTASASPTLKLSGADAALFEISNGELYLKQGQNLDYEDTNNSDHIYQVGISASAEGYYNASGTFTLSIIDVNENLSAFSLSTNAVSLAENTSARTALASFTITDDALGEESYSLSGSDASLFEVANGQLYLKAGQSLDYEASATKTRLVSIAVDGGGSGANPAAQTFTLTLTDANENPSALALSRATHSLAENSSTASRLKMADITITDDALGTNTLSVAGSDAASFEIYEGDLYLKSGVSLNYESKSSYSVLVAVDGGGSGANPAAKAFSLTVSDVDENPSALTLSRTSHSLAENTSTASRLKMADITIKDDALGTNTLSVAGTDAASFEIYDGDLYLKSGVSLNYESKASYSVSVSVSGTGTGSNPATHSFALNIVDINEAPSAVSANKNVVTGDADKSDYVLAASDFSVTDEDDTNWAATTITALPTISSVTLEYNDGGTWKEIISDSLVVSGNQIKLASVGQITRANINKLRFSPDADYQAPPNGGKASFGFTLHDRTTGSADKTGNLFTLTVNQRPTVTSILSQIVTASIAYSLDFSTYFTDLDDTTLSGSWGLTVSGAGNTLPTGLSLHTSGSDKGKITGTGTSTSYGKYALTASYTDAANSAVTTSTSFDLFYLEAGTANADGTRTTPLSKQFYNALAGDDVIAGSAAQDVILGGSGDDFILSGGGADILDGGAGQDTLSFAGITAAITFSLVGTRDQGGYLTATGGSTARVRGFEHIIGGSGADTLTGDDKPNIIEGGPGADTLRGGGGVDTVSYAHASTGVNVPAQQPSQ